MKKVLFVMMSVLMTVSSFTASAAGRSGDRLWNSGDVPTEAARLAEEGDTVCLILYWDIMAEDGGRIDTILAPRDTFLAPLIPKIVRPDSSFVSWYDEFNERFDPGGVPPCYWDGESTLEGVERLNDTMKLYAKWKSDKWLYEPVLLEMDLAEGSLEEAWKKLKQDNLYAITRLEIKDTVKTGFEGGNSSWYSKNLRDKVISLDLREAHIPAGIANYDSVWCNTSSILQEIRLPVDLDSLGSGTPFGYIAPSVQAIYLPAGIKKISSGTGPCERPFAYAYSLKDIYLDADSLNESPNDNLWYKAGRYGEKITLHVPEGTYTYYRNAHINIVERPKVVFNTGGGTRPLYTYPVENEKDLYYCYVDSGTSAFSNNFPVDSISTIKNGYLKFAGWFINNDTAKPYTIDTLWYPGRRDTLYARWDTVIHTVYFDTQGGSFINPITVRYNDTVSKPLDPEKQGATIFYGWHTYTGVKWDFANKIVSDTTLYGRWNTDIYTVNFDMQGGSPPVSPVSGLIYGNMIKRPADPVRTGYDFIDWYFNGDPWDFAASTVTSNMTLYAGWGITKYTVTFSAQGGTPEPLPLNVEYGSLIAVPEIPVRGGYNFAGWYTSPDFTAGTEWDFFASKVTSAVVLYAKWNEITDEPPIEEPPTGIAPVRTASQPTFYPNPANDRITVEGLNGTETLTLSDLTGRIIFSRPVNSGETVSVAGIPSGVYLVRTGGKALRLVISGVKIK